jgi:hypothetical protein
MPVSAVGTSVGLSGVRRLSVAVVAVFSALAYLYGPAASPAMRDAAIATCNDYAQGNYRSFRLAWEVGVYPHWTCWDASRPDVAPVSLGWWTNPFV